MSSIYNLDYLKYLIIFNPVDRDPIPMGMLRVDSEFMVEALKTLNYTLHQFQPLQLTDKVGFLKTGDDACEVLLDSLQLYMQNQIAAGGPGMMTMQQLADAMLGQDIKVDDAKTEKSP